jgi:hypothetical protein
VRNRSAVYERRRSIAHPCAREALCACSLLNTHTREKQRDDRASPSPFSQPSVRASGVLLSAFRGTVPAAEEGAAANDSELDGWGSGRTRRTGHSERGTWTDSSLGARRPSPASSSSQVPPPLCHPASHDPPRHVSVLQKPYVCCRLRLCLSGARPHKPKRSCVRGTERACNGGKLEPRVWRSAASVSNVAGNRRNRAVCICLRRAA